MFDGAYFAGYGSATMANLIHFDLYYLGSLVWTSGTLDPSAVPTFLASGYSGLVDRVHVSSQSGDYYVMDNVTYSTSAVPEPASMILLGTGLVGAASRRWRRRRS